MTLSELVLKQFEGSNSLNIEIPLGEDNYVNYVMHPRSPVHDYNGPSPKSRKVFVATHVITKVFDYSKSNVKAIDAIDWDATMDFRKHIFALGFGVADSMDTAQRGTGLNWIVAKELIYRTGELAKEVNGEIAFGVNTDQVDTKHNYDLDDLYKAYMEQALWVEKNGGIPVLMASRELAKIAKSFSDYEYVYARVFSGLKSKVILHWLGAAFDPLLENYWGSDNIDSAQINLLSLMNKYVDEIQGVKISLLDADREILFRRALPEPIRMYSGDDFNYVALVEGDEVGYSNALLGIFDGIAAPARAALEALDHGDIQSYRQILEPTLSLSRHIFCAPTSSYKTGLVFLAWLNGHQKAFRMLEGMESSRSIEHLIELFVLADQCGALSKPELAVLRMQNFLTVNGLSKSVCQ
jgi:hypothetical protein